MKDQAVVRTLGSLTRVTGVRGAMIVDAEAGVPVVSELVAGVDEKALAAMAGALYKRTADAVRTAAFGDLRIARLDAADGHVLIAAAGPLLVVVLTERDAQLGMVRVQARRAAREVNG
jgi:predicted regulator of Ras-like GTPase activity (Roadblock/LC7/MglB family)